MATGLLLQYTVVALLVALSAGYVFKRQWPAAARRLRIACAAALLRDGRSAWLHRVGRWIAPPSQGSGGACGTGCDGCGPKSPGR